MTDTGKHPTMPSKTTDAAAAADDGKPSMLRESFAYALGLYVLVLLAYVKRNQPEEGVHHFIEYIALAPFNSTEANWGITLYVAKLLTIACVFMMVLPFLRLMRTVFWYTVAAFTFFFFLVTLQIRNRFPKRPPIIDDIGSLMFRVVDIVFRCVRKIIGELND